jgi:hypothetical protein
MAIPPRQLFKNFFIDDIIIETPFFDKIFKMLFGPIKIAFSPGEVLVNK